MIVTGVTKAGLEGFARGIHHEHDDYYMALYSQGASLNKNTAAYTSGSEVTGKGYTPGGMKLAPLRWKWADDFLIVYFDDPCWTNATIKAFGGLIYNKSKGSRSVYVGSFGREVISVNAPFYARFPAATAREGVIRFALD